MTDDLDPTDSAKTRRTVDAWNDLFDAHPELLSSSLTPAEMLQRYWAWFPDIVAQARAVAVLRNGFKPTIEAIDRMVEVVTVAGERMVQSLRHFKLPR